MVYRYSFSHDQYHIFFKVSLFIHVMIDFLSRYRNMILPKKAMGNLQGLIKRSCLLIKLGVIIHASNGENDIMIRLDGLTDRENQENF